MNQFERRARLLKAIETGRLTVAQAETIAIRRGLEAVDPPEAELDPMGEPRWTLPMAAAYLAWGLDAVARYMPERRSYYWRDTGRGLAREQARPYLDLRDLTTEAAFREANGEEGARGAREAAEKRLWALLASGALAPTAYDPMGGFVRLDRVAMGNLREYPSIHERGAYAFKGTPWAIAYRDLTIDRDELLQAARARGAVGEEQPGPKAAEGPQGLGPSVQMLADAIWQKWGEVPTGFPNRLARHNAIWDAAKERQPALKSSKRPSDDTFDRAEKAIRQHMA